jgi:hypothetical protein
MADEEDKFWELELDGDNIFDLLKWAINDELVGIVSEDDGGIIIYCHRDTTQEMLRVLKNG